MPNVAWANDRAAIVASLRELGAKNRRRPTSSDLHSKRPGPPSYSKTVAVYGFFAAALEAAGPAAGTAWTRAQVLAALQDWTGHNWQCEEILGALHDAGLDAATGRRLIT